MTSELPRSGSIRSFGFVTSTSRRSLFADDEVNKEALNPYTTDGNSTDGEHDMEFLDNRGDVTMMMTMRMPTTGRGGGLGEFSDDMIVDDPTYSFGHHHQQRKSRKLRWITLILVFIAVAAAVVMVVVSTGGGGGGSSASSSETTGYNNDNYMGDNDGTSMTPPTLHPTVAFVISNTLPPTREGYVPSTTTTTAPPTTFEDSDLAGFYFESTDDLQAAVDAYLQCVDDYLTPDACATRKIYPPDITTWNVSSIEDFSALFAAARIPQAATFNADLHQWDVSNAITMNSMFQGAEAFNGNISTWDVSTVLDMSYMFQNATSFQGDLSRWRPTQVIYTSFMFAGATAFNADLSGWNISSIQDMSFMFEGATNFNQNLCQWGNSLDLDYTVVMSTFTGTSCESQEDALLTANSDGTNTTTPLCAVCA